MTQDHDRMTPKWPIWRADDSEDYGRMAGFRAKFILSHPESSSLASHTDKVWIKISRTKKMLRDSNQRVAHDMVHALLGYLRSFDLLQISKS